jgi:regulator of sigma E protease
MMIVFQAIAFLVAISLLVAVHEFGHYFVAKKLGFKVLRFSIGFGKPLLTRIGKDRDRTEYCISAIPLGGYVKMLDEREGEVSSEDLPRSFTRRPILHRIAVLLAGPAMNLLFAALAYAALGMIGSEVIKPVVGQVRLDSPAAAAGLAKGDQILKVGDYKVTDTEELQIALMRRFSDDGVVPLNVLHNGVEKILTLRVTDDRRTLTEPGKLLPGLGFDLPAANAAVVVREVPAGSEGERVGLKVSDRLVSVNGHTINNSPDFVRTVSAMPDEDITLGIQRGKEALSLSFKMPKVTENGHSIGRLGIQVKEDGPLTWPPGLTETHRLNPWDALKSGVQKTWEMSALTVQMLWRIITGHVSAKNLNGVISIAEFAGISAMLGIVTYLSFLAVISVSLGVLNLMPVPLLDGGQVVYQLVEWVKGSPLSDRAQMFGQQVGIALLVVLMSLAFYNDISRHLN